MPMMMRSAPLLGEQPPTPMVRACSSRGIAPLALSRVPKPDANEAQRVANDVKALSALSLLDERPAWAIGSDELQLDERIGIGTFGIVYRARWRGRAVAVKQLRIDKGSSSSGSSGRAYAFIAEMQLMADLEHPHVVRFLAGCLEQGAVSMVHELCVHSLHDVLHGSHVLHRSLGLPVAVTLRWAREIALGVAYLHRHEPPVVHRDLKPGNVLLDAGWVAKIADFGSARLREHVAIETARLGTCQWTAPEVLRQQPHDERADSYSFGVLLYELASRRLPYEDVALHLVEVGILTGRQSKPDAGAALRRATPAPPASVVESISGLAQACLEDDYTKRPRFQQIESELQSAQNMLIRDSDLIRELLQAEPLQPEPQPSSGASRTNSSSSMTLMEGSDFASVSNRQLHDLLLRSKELLTLDAIQLDSDEQARRARGDDADDSDSDSDRSSLTSSSGSGSTAEIVGVATSLDL